MLDNPRSTQDTALAYAKSGRDHKKLVFYSKNQRQGYGTNGREWISAENSFAASFVFPVSLFTSIKALPWRGDENIKNYFVST